ncbi:MAG TPA: hypothetical protein VLX92_09290 [Kofleriaceae bacterium]|nr:hypothetical protein [Kofleriaceae bacterium]
MMALDKVEELFANGKPGEARAELAALIERVAASPRARDEAIADICPRIACQDPRVGAYLALAGGALVEHGAPAGELARAIAVPLRRALDDAHRLLALAGELADEEGDDLVTEVAGKSLSRATVDALARRDRAMVRAWFSLADWYRPAVACWSRDTLALRAIQRDAGFRGALAALGRQTETSHWLSLLLETVFDARFVVLVPELRQAWSFVGDGVVDMGQLSVLLSEPLAGPLAQIGASGRASDDMLAVMRGDGPQQQRGATYGSSFHIYPRQALREGMPRDDVHTWSAPGGTGTHSLPADFLPGTLDEVDGARPLVLVGPNAPGTRFVRVIPAVRTFRLLAARVSALEPVDFARWLTACEAG